MSWGVSDLTVRYRSRVALDDVSLDVPEASVTAVVGADGSGKSTLLRALVGGIRPDAGTVRRPPSAQIGYFSGPSAVYPDLTVAENLEFAARAYHVTARERRAELLAAAGLEHVPGRLAGHLSGGMRCKLGLVMAMVHEPLLLVLDEPSTGIDPVSRAELTLLINRAAAAGTAVLLSTAYLDEGERAAHVLVLDAGRALRSGDPEQIIASVPGTVLSSAARPEAGRARLLDAAGVTRRFGSFTANEGIDLHVGAGEIVGLLGANGAGKTTFMRIVLGLLRPSAGTIALLGQPPSRAVRRRIGYVPQGLGLYEDLTVAQNLEFAARAYGYGGAGSDALVDADLRAESGTLVGELPLGLRRRLAFATALGHGPSLLVLDEPTSGVDPLGRGRLWDIVRDRADRGAGALVSTHYMEEAEHCDRLVVLSAGRVVVSGTLASIIGGRRALQIATGRWEAAFRALDAAGLVPALHGRTLRLVGADESSVAALLGAAGVEAELSWVPASFEEAFVALVAEGGGAP